MSSATQPSIIELPPRLLEKQPEPSHKWQLPGRGRGLLSLLEQQSALVVEGARLLSLGSMESCLPRISEIYRQIHETERQLVEKLQATLITPVAAEDMQTLSSRLRRVIHKQAGIARARETLRDNHLQALPELANHSLACANSLASAIRALPEDPALLIHTEQVKRDCISAKKSLRNWRCELLAVQTLPVVMRPLEFLSLPEELFQEYRRTARVLDHILFKNA